MKVPKAFLEAQNRGACWTPLQADVDAEYDQVIDINLSEVEPMAACPSSPDNIKNYQRTGRKQR